MNLSPDIIKKMSSKELNAAAAEIRQFLIDKVSRTGGHLASNLGIVELTLALHYCFDTPKDKIVWDVGHTAYVHKMITGRMERFNTLRQTDGMSGFPRVYESEHDVFDTGHSSTSISAALGMAVARDIQGGDNSVIAVIGDGAMTGGLAFEGLNNGGRIKKNFIIILNDNEMSISTNVGSLAKYLNRIRTGTIYNKAKHNIELTLDRIPKLGKNLAQFISRFKSGLKHLALQGALFEEMGFTYIGPVDGHDVKELIAVLNKVRKIEGPVLLHVFTKKGKGCKYAELSPNKYHGVQPFNVATGSIMGGASNTMTAAFGKEITAIAHLNPKVVAITAAMRDGTGLSEFSLHFPRRFFDVGIAEGHAVTFAAGMARCGFVPVVAVYSTFLQRAYDNIVHDVALQRLPVVFMVDRAGVVGEDGETHQGVYDVAYLSHIPNMTVLSPSCEEQLVQMLRYAVSAGAPVAIRYPKSITYRCASLTEMPFICGKAEVIRSGDKITIVTTGTIVHAVIHALEMTKLSADLIYITTIKPLDSETIKQSVDKTGRLLVIEECASYGGIFGMLSGINCKKRQLSLPDTFIPHGKTEDILARHKLSPEAIADTIAEFIHSSH